MRKCAGLAVVLAASLVGCAHLAPPAGPGAGARDCGALFAEVDRTVQRSGVHDGAAARIDGFPYLRVDRLLASFAGEALSDAQFEQWTARMGALDRSARSAELGNLPQPEQARLRDAYGGLEPLLDRCRDSLRAADLQSAQRRALLRDRARVPDDYDTWKRVVGLYWLTRLPFAGGVKDYQEEVARMFQTPLERLPVGGRLAAYSPPASPVADAAQVRAILARAADNALRIPDPSAEDLELLFQAFAPRWVVDERDANDRIGRLVLGRRGVPQVDTRTPVVYRRVAHTRAGDATLLQLVYSVWFPARPKSSAADLLGGALDGIVWRVTLAPDGTPLVYDSIHTCGCYHQFFPTPRAQPLPPPEAIEEGAFVPQRLDATAWDAQIALRVESGTHYLQRVSAGVQPQGAQVYAFAADDTLRSLPHPDGGRRSAFRADGIVPGSQRGERYVFWPMGVRDAGAMRQWGRHATAFVGRRHFDEVRLLERYFRLELQ